MKRPRHWLIVGCNIGNIFGVAVDIHDIVEITGDIAEDCSDIVGTTECYMALLLGTMALLQDPHRLVVTER